MSSATLPKLRWFIRFCAIGILPVLFVQLFPSDITLFQLLESFLIQTLIGGILLFAFAVWTKEKLSAISFGTVAIIILIKAFPYYWPFGMGWNGEPDLTIGHYNLWHHNEDPSAAIQAISDQNADIIGIQELNSAWLDELSILDKTHPYSFTVPHDTCCYGIGLYSKYPITIQDQIDLEKTPALEVEVEVNGRSVKLLYLHARPPAFPDQSQSRNKQLEAMGERAKKAKSNWILFGDFNIVPWSIDYQNMVKESGGEDSRKGFQATFPADYISLIPIDHVVHSMDMECTGFQSYKLEGSDHKGIVAGFRFK
ncbi:MAG: endonuclease/exonuclease/phosphatase (EEP) superfamily protein YafD [Granulosicoccus sp.]